MKLVNLTQDEVQKRNKNLRLVGPVKLLVLPRIDELDNLIQVLDYEAQARMEQFSCDLKDAKTVYYGYDAGNVLGEKEHTVVALFNYTEQIAEREDKLIFLNKLLG